MALKATLTQVERQQLDAIPTADMAAYRAFHEGIRTQQSNDNGDRARAMQYFEEALDRDPGFDRAAMELVGLLSLKNFRRKDAEQITRAEALIDALRTCSPDSAELSVAEGFAFTLRYVLSG